MVGIARSGAVDGDVGDDRAGARGHHEHAVGDGDGFIDAVGDEDGRAWPRGVVRRHGPEVQQLVAHLLAGHLVEGGERLVHEQQRRIDCEGAGDRDALLHPAGERVGPVVAELLEADQLDQLVDGDAVACLAGVELASEADVRLDVAPGQQGGLLEDEAEFLEPLGGDGVVAEDGDRAGGRLLEACDQAQQRGFAAAAGADEGDELAGGDRERRGRDGLQRLAVCGDVGERDVAEFDRVAGRGHRRFL